MCGYKATIHMINKLHGKTFVTWKRLHVFIGIPIRFVAQMQTNMSKVFKATKLSVVQMQTKIYVKSIQNNKSIIIHMKTRNLFQDRNIVYHVILTLAGPCIIIQSK